MADVAAIYELDTPAGSVFFNQGDLGDGTDKLWINDIQGLDFATLAVPFDPVPFGDGLNIHTTRKRGMTPVFDGMLLIESPVNCMARRNALSEELYDALNSILSPAIGTLIWTPSGLSERSLVVHTLAGLSISYSDNFTVSNFSFQLISAESDPFTGT